MSCFLPCIVLCFIHFGVSGQQTMGITGSWDTTFNLNSEYAKIRRQFPEIQLPENADSKWVKTDENIVYHEIGNRALLLDIFSPQKPGNGRRTAIMIIHGGGWRSGDKSLHHSLAGRLAALGYVCFTPEYRLSTEALFPAAVYDLKAAVLWVRKNAGNFGINPDRVIVMGHSAGGQLATYLGVTNFLLEPLNQDSTTAMLSSVNAVVNIDGILAFIHPESGEGDDSKRTSAATYWFGYTKQENPSLWKSASPLTYVGKDAPPILFLNSMVERMHAGRDDYTKILSNNNIYFEVKTYKNAPHSFCLFEPWFTPMLNEIHLFIQKLFPPQGD